MSAFYRKRDADIIRPRRPLFSGQPHEWMELIEAWGVDACELMRRCDDRAYYSAQLAMRFARKAGLLGEGSKK